MPYLHQFRGERRRLAGIVKQVCKEPNTEFVETTVTKSAEVKQATESIPTRFMTKASDVDLMLNLDVAKNLGLTVPLF